MSLRAREVSWSAGGTLIVDRVSVRIEPESMLGILGPNGSGKSSLLRLMAGLRRPSSGAVLLCGDDLARVPRRELARRLAVVEQEASTDADLTVTEVVSLGRTPHRRAWAGMRAVDASAVADALDRTGLTSLAHRRWHSLSGGERQRAQIARALAQQPSELLLDEPTNHLDIAHQLALLDFLRGLPVTSVVALHDLNLAAAFCDRLLVLAYGRAIAAGEPAEVLTEDLIRDVYGVRSTITPDEDGRPHIRFCPPSPADVTIRFAD